MSINRRNFLSVTGAGAATLAMPAVSFGQAKPKVVVIGGGAGGATAARYIAKDSKGAVDVTLIEANKRYYTCFFSNLYLGGFRDYASIGHGYDGLAAHGVNVVHDWAASVDSAAKTVTLASGASVSYDKLVLSPDRTECVRWLLLLLLFVPFHWTWVLFLSNLSTPKLIFFNQTQKH